MADITSIIDQFLKDTNSTNLSDAAERGRRIKANFEAILRELGIISVEVENTTNLIQVDGDGTKYLSDDGTYKTVISGSSADFNIDGGAPDSVYLSSQLIDGGEVEWLT